VYVELKRLSGGKGSGCFDLSERIRSQTNTSEGWSPSSRESKQTADEMSAGAAMNAFPLTESKLLIAAFPPYFLCNMFVKLAWLTFYYGLARTRGQRYFLHFMQFTAVGFGLSSVLVIVLQCIPLDHVWRKNVLPPSVVDSAKCINLMAFFYANAIIMIVNDVVMYLTPVFLLRNVDMLQGHRWSIYAMFGVGGL
jgi:hypothetical protein